MHEVILLLETDPVRGLTTAEADARRQRFGPNVLPPNRSHGPVVRFLLQLHNPLIYVLLGAAAVTAAIGSVVDTAVILGVVLVNAIVGYVQEWKAGRALEALAAATRTMATVVRDGTARRVDSTVLVPGDLVTIEAGDKVPADLRLIRVHDLHVDESALTGESVPVAKADVLVPTDTTLGDRVNMAYSSTLVTGGAGTGIAVATGAATEIGLIHQLVGAAEGVQTPLTRKLQAFSRWLTVVILALAAVTFAIGVVRGESPAEMVVAAVALAVGAIPEGLPAAVTITLAIGVSRMARRNAIIRKLPAAETLGSTTMVCTDKTGTLTQNRMTVQYLYEDGRVRDLAAVPDPAARACLVAGVLCNDAGLSVDDAGRVSGLGDPTEVALLLAASERGLVEHPDVQTWRRIDHLPFSSDLRLMATLHVRGTDEPGVVWVKGAAEEVLARCSDARASDGTSVPVDRDDIERQLSEFGDRALRVLAFASGEVPRGWRFEVDGLDSIALTFLGLQAMSDPPRPEAIRAIEACRTAGIRVLMITGDHARTARAIAREMGVAGDADPVVLTGAELAAIDPEELPNRLASADVLARVSAEQKLRVVEALQHLGHVVAMTGDGVNDAPALKQADIGIAMGLGGTEVAKESADMVLTDDDFASIESAVEEGRSVFDNLTKFIAWTLPTNIGEGLVVLVAIVVGAVLPILPVQILWINMTTAVALGLMLAFEPAEPGIMRRPPRPPRQPILTRRLVVRIVLVGVLMLIGAFGCFEWALAQGASLEEARTLAVNAFVAMEIGYLVNCRSLDRSVLSVGLFSNRLLLLGVAIMVALQLALTYLPFMNAAFQTAPLRWSDWVAVAALGAAVAGIIGVEKRLSRRR